MIKRCFATILFLLHCGLAFAADGPRALSVNFSVMDPPWDVPDLLFTDSKGGEHLLRSYMKNELRGRYVLLNLWATWCTPCVSEMPSLNRLQALMGPRNLSVIALSVDREGSVAVPAFYRRNNLNQLKVYWDSTGTALRRLHLRGIPTTLLINPNGQEIGRVASHVDWTREDNLAFLSRMIGAPLRF
ncbi:MAG: TlpA disulfide reductase family protein [Alphaproteobacteria bacterium]|nr:TlpA disulfide reductase family protein [Alphaproteobacteria bacterium]